MTYSDWIETETREECDREAISKKLKKGRTPEWIQKEDGYPMELILEVQASGESKNRAHREPQGRNPVVDCADVDTTSLYGKLMALETYKKAYEDSVCGVYACERIAMKLRRGSTPAWIHEEDEYDMDLILEVQAELGELVGHHTRNGKVGSYNEYRNARLAADPELKAEYDALGPEYEQAQEELQAYKKGLA